MGGHGGLNILPQKSWNVYGRDNRLKVARDEEKHREEENAKLEKHMQAEREHRRAMLLQRAAARDGSELATPSVPIPGHLASEDDLQITLIDQASEAKPPQHINFFEEHEAREMHPEVVAERKNERRKRGNVDTQTSDAKFDEKFQLGYGLIGKAAQPWYSRPVPPAPLETDVRLQVTSGGPWDGDGVVGPPLLIRHKEKHKKERKKDRKEKRKKESRAEEGKKAFEKLRQERRDREAAERERERRVQLGRALADTEGYLDKRYHSAFGNAPKKQRL